MFLSVKALFGFFKSLISCFWWNTKNVYWIPFCETGFKILLNRNSQLNPSFEWKQINNDSLWHPWIIHVLLCRRGRPGHPHWIIQELCRKLYTLMLIIQYPQAMIYDEEKVVSSINGICYYRIPIRRISMSLFRK